MYALLLVLRCFRWNLIILMLFICLFLKSWKIKKNYKHRKRENFFGKRRKRFYIHGGDSDHRRLIKGQLLFNFSYHWFVPDSCIKTDCCYFCRLIGYYLDFLSSLFGLCLCRFLHGFIVLPSTL